MRRVWGPGARGEKPAVLSLAVQAGMAGSERVKGQFELLVRHFFDRMVHNEAFGEDGEARALQAVYALGLPGMLAALFLFAAYHQPPRPYVRAYWSMAADHLFYVVYAMVVMGVAVVFEWELLFPDLLDVYVLAGLPVRGMQLLGARVAALAVSLGMVGVGANGLGALFLPGVSDLRVGFWRHFAAHVTVVGMAGAFAVMSLVTLQAVLVLLPGRRLPEAASAGVRAGVMVMLLTVLFLLPLTAHSIRELVLAAGVSRWYPPFWFLGVYEWLVWGRLAMVGAQELAWTGVGVTAGLAATASLLYPLAYARRVRRVVEGSSAAATGPGWWRRRAEGVLGAVLVRRPGVRATFYFAAQTLGRMERLRLYLAMYAGVGLALTISGCLVFVRVAGAGLRPTIAPDGVRLAVPVVAFWAVAGLAMALRTPLGRHGGWMFQVTERASRVDELRGAELLVGLVAATLTVGTTTALHAISQSWGGIGAQIAAGLGLAVVLTDAFFLGTRTLPFSAARVASVRALPMTLVLYFVAFPAMALWIAGMEAGAEASGVRAAKMVMGFAVTHVVLRAMRSWVLRREAPTEEMLFTGIGLREG